MSTITEKTWDLFMDASLSDDDLGYPRKVAFVPGDEDWVDDVVWRNLVEGRPTVVVAEDTELLLVPKRRKLIDRLRGRVAVNIGQRDHGRAWPFVTTSCLGRRPVREMRERPCF
ncbi:MAG: hypothetical protein ACTHM1_07035 [Solirubrobacteraceae bacterium]